MRLDLPKKLQLSLVEEEQPEHSPKKEPQNIPGEDQGTGSSEEKNASRGDSCPEESPANLYQKIQQSTVAEKIKLAMLGNKEARAILLRETNKQVLLAVLHSPKITESEVESISNSRNMPEEVLREISKNREWCRNNKIVTNLVKNPKTPLDVSIRFIPRLDTKSLRDLAKSKNIPAALRTAVVRYLEQREKKKQG